MQLPLRIRNLGAQLRETVLLGLALPLKLVERLLPLDELCFRGMAVLVGFLALLEGELDAANDADVFVHRDANSKDVLGCLPLVELLDADLEGGEVVEGRRERFGELDGRESMEGAGKVGRRFREILALLDDAIYGFEEVLELNFKGVEVLLAIVKKLDCSQCDFELILGAGGRSTSSVSMNLAVLESPPKPKRPLFSVGNGGLCTRCLMSLLNDSDSRKSFKSLSWRRIGC